MPFISEKDLAWLWRHCHYPTYEVRDEPPTTKLYATGKGFITKEIKRRPGFYIGQVGPSRSMVRAIHKGRLNEEGKLTMKEMVKL